MTGERAEHAGVWVHAVCRDSGVPEIAGVGGERVRAVRAAGLTAVVSTVDLAGFGEEALARNLENLTWLETVARTHHRVVEAVGGRGPVIPTRLATIHRDDDCVAAMLAERRTELRSALDRFAGRVEWGVKAYAASAGTAPSAGVADEHDSSPGTRYLRQRRAQLSGRDEARRAVVEDAETLHRALAQRAEADRRHPPQAAGLSGRSDWMVLNGTYLVPEDAGAGFAAAVEELAQRYPRLDVELTGPWPPYSFAVPEEDAGS